MFIVKFSPTALNFDFVLLIHFLGHPVCINRLISLRNSPISGCQYMQLCKIISTLANDTSVEQNINTIHPAALLVGPSICCGIFGIGVREHFLQRFGFCGADFSGILCSTVELPILLFSETDGKY